MDGLAEPRFAPVRERFRELIADGRETGAALAIWSDGRPVVDLVGGRRCPVRDRPRAAPAREGPWETPAWDRPRATAVRDRPRATLAREQPWRANTLVNVFSVGKPVAALCLLLLIDRDQVGLDDPVSRHWPGFTAPATVRQLLSHTAGLPVFPVRRPATALADWALLCADLAAAAPQWSPGSAAAEHALTYGHLVGEVVRRVDGRPISQFLAEEIAGPWRLDLGFGLDARDQARCADLSYGKPDWPVSVLGEAGSLRAAALGNPSGYLDLAVLNGPLWRGAVIPAVNLHATATGLARLYAGLLAGGRLAGVRLLNSETVAELTRVQYDGADLLLNQRTRWTLGMQVEPDGSWGMGGIGGSAAWADPERGYTFAYATARLAGFDRVEALTETLHDCLGVA